MIQKNATLKIQDFKTKKQKKVSIELTITELNNKWSVVIYVMEHKFEMCFFLIPVWYNETIYHIDYSEAPISKEELISVLKNSFHKIGLIGESLSEKEKDLLKTHEIAELLKLL